MDALLIVVALVSLALATGMSLVAWKVLRDNHRRSAERSEALAELADAADLTGFGPEPAIAGVGFEPAMATAGGGAMFHEASDAPDSSVSTFGVLGLSSAASPVPERAESVENRYDPQADPQALLDRAPIDQTLRRVPMTMFGAEPEPEPVAATAGGRRWLAIVAAMVLTVGGAGAVYAAWNAQSSSHGSPLTAVSAAQETVDLLSLRESTDEPGVFVVTGLVGSLPDRALPSGIVAVVYLFDQDGRFFTSGQAALENVPAAGAQSPFTVRILTSVDVSRYRIGFRDDRGSVVPHVDRRTTHAQNGG